MKNWAKILKFNPQQIFAPRSIEVISLILTSGETIKINSSNKNLFDATRPSLGPLEIVTDLTLQLKLRALVPLKTSLE